MRTAFQARGFNHISTTEQERWINQAYQELCEEAPWPFLEVSTSGVSPLSLTDVRTILSVSDTTTQRTLWGLDRRDVVDQDPDMNDTGSPEYFYLDDNTLTVYPANTTDTIAVRYIEVPDVLDSDSDTPDIPTRFQELIVDGAVIKAYKAADEFDAAQMVRVEWNEGVMKMRRSLLDRNWANAGSIKIVDLEDWSL